MRKYGDDAKYSSLDVMYPICGSWHSIYTECSQCGGISYRSSYASSSYKNDYTRDYNQDYNEDYDEDYNEPHNSTSYKAVICSECGKTYNRAFYDLCPFCARSKSKHKTFKPKYSTKKSNNDSNQWVKCKFCGRLYYRSNKGPCPHCNKSKPQKCPSEKYEKSKSKSDSLTTCPTCGRKIIKGSLCPLCYITCSKCGKRYNKNRYDACPHCNIECSKCGNIYSTIDNVSCPHCKDKKNLTFIFALLILIVFIIIMASLF